MAHKIYLPLIAALALSSCSSIRHTSATADVDTRVVSFTVADVDVRPEKVSATQSWGFNPFKRIDVGLVKTNTTARLVNENNADVLVEPQYIVEHRGFLRGGSVTVTGYPATYSNFHKMTPEEAKIFNEVKSASKGPEKHKKFFFF